MAALPSIVCSFLALISLVCSRENVDTITQGRKRTDSTSAALDEQKAKDVHNAISQLLKHKIGKTLKEAAKEVKITVDNALGKHLSQAHDIVKQKVAKGDVIVMDPTLSKLVKNAVKNGKKQTHGMAVKQNKTTSNGDVHRSHSSGQLQNHHVQANRLSQPYGAHTTYNRRPGSPQPQAGHPQRTRYTPRPGHPQQPGHLLTAGYPQYPQGYGYPPIPQPGYSSTSGYTPFQTGYPYSQGYSGAQMSGYPAVNNANPGSSQMPVYSATTTPDNHGTFGKQGMPGGAWQPDYTLGQPGYMDSTYGQAGYTPGAPCWGTSCGVQQKPFMQAGCTRSCQKKCYLMCPRACCNGKRGAISNNKKS